MTTIAKSIPDEPTHRDDSPQNNSAASTGPALAHVTEQPGLPIKFDSKRGCDQIRARIYHDDRLTGLELAIGLALSEFVNTSTFAAYPKQKLLGRMVHATRPKVSNALHRLEIKRVIHIDRSRAHCRYVFRAEWRGRFQVVPKAGAKDSRCSRKEHLDVPERNISNTYTSPQLPLDSDSSKDDHAPEPYVLNQVRTLIAAADAESVQRRDDQQQQRQKRNDDRIDGLISAIAVRARKLDKTPYDERDERRRLAAGEIDVDDLQRLADDLQEQLVDRRRR